MIHVYHGNGKGKTTAAIGLAVRAAGAGRKVLFTQFMKGNISSEIGVLREIPGITVLLPGIRSGFYREMSESDKEAVSERHNEILREIKRRMEAGEADVIVMDEIAHAYRYRLLDRELAGEIIRLAKKTKAVIKEEQAVGEDDGEDFTGSETELILTGREPDESFLEAADYITEMKQQRHPYERGIPARKGIEW